MARAMRRAASRSLDLQGTPSHKSFLYFNNFRVASNITSLGVSVGRSEKEVEASVRAIKNLEFDRLAIAPKASSVIDPLMSDEEDVHESHDGQLLSHLIKDRTEVNLDDTEGDAS